MADEAAILSEWRRLLTVEQAAARAQFEAARQALDASARVDAGLALDGLVVADTTAGALGRAAWVLQRRDGGELGPGISPGDPVLLARKRGGPEPLRGLVSRRTRRALTVVFDDPPDEAFEDGELLLERQVDETTHQRLLAGLTELETKTGRTAAWRRLVTIGGTPAPGKPVPFDDPRLNAPQREAVARALAAEELFLVHGPPGTGKTEVLAAIAAAAIALGTKVIACAASNAAVDNLVARLGSRGVDAVRLGHPARVHPLLLEHTLEARTERHEKAQIAVSLTNEARQLLRRADRAVKQGRAPDRFVEARSARGEARRLFAEARTLARAAEDEVLAKAPAICATLSGLASQRLRGRRFPLAIVDEATQATVPATVLALVRADKVVLAGDQHQLPPTVLSPEAAKGGLARSLYERWHDAHGSTLSRMLEVQHRMHREIMAFPSTQLYGGRLVAHASVESHLLADLPGVARDDRTTTPFLFVDSAGKGWTEETPPGSQSQRNPGEAARVAREVEALRAAGVAARDIGVIAPYSAQVQLLRSLLADEELEVDTVDAFQGREKEAICVSLTRSNDEGELGFCADVRRMNVALTRARRRLFVVGDSATLGGHAFYAAFLEHAQANGAYRSAWEDPDSE